MSGGKAAYQAPFKNTYLSTKTLLGQEVAIILYSIPASADDLAAEINFLLFFPSSLENLMRGYLQLLSVWHINTGMPVIPSCLGHRLLNWGIGSQCSYVSEAVRLHRANSDCPRQLEEYSLGEIWVAHVWRA